MPVFSLLSALAPIAITVMLLVLQELSRRLGEVLRIRHIHRWYYLAAFLTFISSIIRLLSIGLEAEAFDTTEGDSIFAAAYTLSLMSGVSLGLAITWRYWGWLVYASDGKTLTPTQRR